MKCSFSMRQLFTNFLFIVIFAIFCPSALCIDYGKNASQLPREMTLTDAVFLAIRHNRNIKSAYMDRVAQRWDLKVAEDEFVPDLDINPSVKRFSTGEDGSRTTTNETRLDTIFRQRIPTGAEFVFRWANTGQRSDQDAFNSSWDVVATQPLLRGGGVEVNTAALRTARLTDTANILTVKSTVINTVTSTILLYRQFLQAQKELEIAENSLKRAQRLLEINKELIASGRMARVEIVQTQADVTNRELGLIGTKNALDRARLALLAELDIDKNLMAIPVEKATVTPIDLDAKRFKDMAFQMRPDYLQSLLILRISEIDLVVAKNNRLWDLLLEGRYGITGESEKNIDEAVKRSMNEGRSQWNVGLSLNIPIGDLTRRQIFEGAKVNVKQQKLNLEELKDNIEIQILDAVRDIDLKHRQVVLARQARELSVQKLDIEKEKLKFGRSTNFQVVTFENDLVNAQVNELSAVIEYLNALTRLDQILGTTLDTWKIDFNAY